MDQEKEAKSQDAAHDPSTEQKVSVEVRVVETDDGSRTLYLPGLDETYHSTHGAVTESRHVYIEKGLDFWRAAHPEARELRVFEMGLGTGIWYQWTCCRIFNASQHLSLSDSGCTRVLLFGMDLFCNRCSDCGWIQVKI